VLKHKDRAASQWLAGLLAALLCAFACAAPAATLKSDEFLKSWMVLMPIAISASDQPPPDEAAQKQAFAQDWLQDAGTEPKIRPRANLKQSIANQALEWHALNSPHDVIDFGADAPPARHAIAYAWAEIDMPAQTHALLGIGSDDAIKIWLNGTLIHDKWAVRAANPDEDVVPANFKRGKNQVLLKVLNLEGGWGFAFRLMGPAAQANKLTQAVDRADLESLKHYLELGIDINGRDELGLTPLQTARLLGHADIADFLTSRGAKATTPLPPREQIVNKLFARQIKSDDAGVAVLVAQNGKVLFQSGYGQSDRENHVPVTPETRFRIGSITKQFTSAAILKLQEQGKLSVQDKLTKYIADFPRGDEVTLHHLLTHTSGIHSYTSRPDFPDKVGQPTQWEELIQSIKRDPYDFDPGTKWLYNNSGYLLLGYIIEKVSGQPYEDFLRTQFFQPIGMENTGVYRADLKLKNEALGYQRQGYHFTRAPNWDMTWAGGAGALYSTVGDLYRWNEALFNGKVLTEPSLRAAFTAARTQDGRDTGYGYGWALSDTRGSQVIAHGGGLPGFSSYLLRMPRENLTVVVLENALPPAPGAAPEPLASDVVQIYLGDQLAPRNTQTVQVSPAALDALVGRYDYGMGIMTVTREGNRLFTQLGNQQRFEVFPRSETEFFWKVVDAQITFVKGGDGKVVKAVHRQGGRELDAPRLEEAKEAKVDRRSSMPWSASTTTARAARSSR
jgi:CubicO group peptidase (beta-lactamase class C family)